MEIQKGKINEASKDLLYGVEGVGKSSLAMVYPSPIFIDCEGSTNKLDVDRLVVRDWNEFKKASKLILGKYKESYLTVVIDTLDWLERIAINEVLRIDQATSITDDWKYSYGKGEMKVKEFFENKLIPTFEAFMKNNKNVVLIAHATIKPFNDPVGGAYDHYALDMMKKTSAVARQWVNNVFFMNYKVKVVEGKGIEKNKAYGSKEVIIHTQRTPQYEAKRREKLNDEIKFTEGTHPFMSCVGLKEFPKPKEEKTE